MPILGEIAAIYSATEEAKAAHKAIDAQKAALQVQRQIWAKELDPERFDALAVEFDKRRIERRDEFLRENDPKLYELRELTKQQLLDRAKLPKSQDQSHILATKLFNEIRNEDPRMAAIKDRLLSAAESDLAGGATLPPEFQAELVRAGLNTGSQAGIGFSQGAIGGGVARLLGTAGEQLRQARNQEAVNLVNSAQNLTTARTNILSAVFPKLRDLETADRNEAVQNFALSQAQAPDIGISGADAINANLMKTNARVGGLQRYADLKAQRGFVDARKNSTIAGASANLVGDIISLAAGGMPISSMTGPSTGSSIPTGGTPSGLGYQTQMMSGTGNAGTGNMLNFLNTGWQ